MNKTNKINFLEFLEKLKFITLSEIKSEYAEINNIFHQLRKSNETIIKSLVDDMDLTIVETINKFSKYKELELNDELFKDLKNYYEVILEVDTNKKLESLDKLSKKLVYKYYTNFPETKLLRPINTCLLNMMNILIPHQSQLKILLEMILELDLKYIGMTIKNTISKKLTRKENSIIENTMHILISSSSDKLGNLVNIIDDKYWYLSNYMNDDIKTEVRDLEKPLSELKKYLDNQSKLFKSFKNEINIMTPDEFYFMIDFIFINGFKVKYPKIKIEIIKKFNNISAICINEYLLINSMYALIENSIEIKASIIQINISNSFEYIYIDIKDNVKGIPERINKYLFDKNFSFNKNGHFGLGLYIAKNWLESVSSKLEYISKHQMMRIIIPYKIKSI
jgi:hypothetical protein